MASRYAYGQTSPVIAPVATAQAVAVGDLVGLDSNTIEKASDTTWDTDLATTQAAFVATFLGVAAQKKVADVAKPYGNSVDNRMRVDTEGVYEFDTASASYNVGDLVGPAKQSGNALENQKVVAVAYEHLAVGRVVEATSSATKVKVRLHSVLCPAGRIAGGSGLVSATIAALTDSSGGSADNTIAAITNANNAGSADVTPTANAIADLAAKVNAIIAVLKDAGLVATA